MTDQRLFMNSLLVIGAALLASVYLYSRGSVAADLGVDGPGPNLVIDVDGQAKGQIVIDLQPELAPRHVAQITELAKKGEYDNVVFHRVIDGFMAQTGDVQYGKKGADLSMAGAGGSDLPNLKAEFSSTPFRRGVVGMARSNDPDSANSQFFIMFGSADSLNGSYTVVGHVVSGMDVVDKIKRGAPDANGKVDDPDVMTTVTVTPGVGQ